MQFQEMYARNYIHIEIFANIASVRYPQKSLVLSKHFVFCHIFLFSRKKMLKEIKFLLIPVNQTLMIMSLITYIWIWMALFIHARIQKISILKVLCEIFIHKKWNYIFLIFKSFSIFIFNFFHGICKVLILLVENNITAEKQLN